MPNVRKEVPKTFDIVMLVWENYHLLMKLTCVDTTDAYMSVEVLSTDTRIDSGTFGMQLSQQLSILLLI